MAELKLTAKEIEGFNGCIAVVNEFLRQFDEKYQCLTGLDMGVMEDGSGYCMETDYIGGFGYPKHTTRMMHTHLYLSKDLDEYLNAEVSFPVEKLGNDVRLIKQIFMILQDRFHMSDEELYFALDQEYFTVFISYRTLEKTYEEITDLLATLKYVTDCCMHMLTNTTAEDKNYYIEAVAEQLAGAGEEHESLY